MMSVCPMLAGLWGADPVWGIALALTPAAETGLEPPDGALGCQTETGKPKRVQWG